MEFEFLPLSFSFLGLLLLFFFLLMVWKTLSKTCKITGKLPPGPRKLPLIGNSHNIFGGLPHVVLMDLAQKYGPLMYLQLGEVSTVIVSSAEMAKEVLVTHGPAFANRPDRLAINIMFYGRQDMIFSPYGDHWRQLRKIGVMELLSNKNVRSLSYIRKDEITELMESIRSSQGVPVNVTEMFFVYTTYVTCRAAFGTISKDTETIIKCLKQTIVLAAGTDAADFFPSLKILPLISRLKCKLLKMHDKMDAFLDDMINQHEQNHKSGKMGNADSGGEDLIDVLLRLQKSGNLQIPITNRNIKALLFDIFTAGIDTSSVTTEWAMSELMKQPRVMAKAQAEVRQVCKGKKTIEEDDIQKLVYLKMVIKENLRLHPAGPLIPRASRENREVKGYMIPNKSQVFVNAYAIARDPEYWDDPEMFKPERFEQKSVDYTGSDFQFLPFGTGRRMCPGLTYGVANIEGSLAHSLFHFDWSLPNGMKPNDLDMDEATGLSISRKNSLHLVATAYCPPLNE